MTPVCASRLRTVFVHTKSPITAPITRPHNVYSGSRAFSQTRDWRVAALADGDLRPLKDRFDLTGRNFVVTGGGRGIGYAAARGIAEFGGNVAILDYSPSPVKDFVNIEREFGVRAKYIRTDVTDQLSLQKAFDETITDFKTLDGWLV